MINHGRVIVLRVFYVRPLRETLVSVEMAWPDAQLQVAVVQMLLGCFICLHDLRVGEIDTASGKTNDHSRFGAVLHQPGQFDTSQLKKKGWFFIGFAT